MARSRVELFEQIRRDWRAGGMSIRELAVRHHVHRRTVRQALASAVPPPRKPYRPRPRPAVGVRTEEARALRWSHVVAWVPKAREWQPVTDAGFRHKKHAVYVWRSVREDGDTKTELSRRTLEIPDTVARALREHHTQQAKQRLQAGQAWEDNDLVFATGVGTPLDAANVRRSFRRITKAAGLGECWTPRELRHSFVSIMSDNGVTIEQIADLVGHRTTIVTQKVYRHQLKPVISTGATAMNTIFGNKKSA
jgi:integrase